MDFLPESESTTPLLSNDFSPLQCTYFGPQLNLPNLQQFTIIAIIPIITTLVLNHHDCCHHCHSYHYHHSVTIESLSFLCFSMSLLFAGMFLFMFPSALTKLKKKTPVRKPGRSNRGRSQQQLGDGWSDTTATCTVSSMTWNTTAITKSHWTRSYELYSRILYQVILYILYHMIMLYHILSN